MGGGELAKFSPDGGTPSPPQEKTLILYIYIYISSTGSRSRLLIEIKCIDIKFSQRN